jgi:hypothetical protein
MKLSEFKNHLLQVQTLNFKLPGNYLIPPHFHITEIGLVTKQFIDCGGQLRINKAIHLQIWVSIDTDHRLEPAKLLNILTKVEKITANEDLELEVEYQTDTLGTYGLDYRNHSFILVAKSTDCLAKEQCGVPSPVVSEITLSGNTKNKCIPQSGCC